MRDLTGTLQRVDPMLLSEVPAGKVPEQRIQAPTDRALILIEKLQCNVNINVPPRVTQFSPIYKLLLP